MKRYDFDTDEACTRVRFVETTDGAYASYEDAAALQKRNEELADILQRFVTQQKSDFEIRGGMSSRWQPLLDAAEAALSKGTKP